ncbi:MAG: hypothetical protein ACI8RD_012985 [Bacillariaceae sp.]|jgi:hypothetical protein
MQTHRRTCFYFIYFFNLFSSSFVFVCSSFVYAIVYAIISFLCVVISSVFRHSRQHSISLEDKDRSAQSALP